MASEERLIDTSQYKSFLKRYIKELYEVDAPMIAGAVERCLYKLEGQPTADAVEVVRCKDCRWARPKDHREPTDTPKQMIICQCFMNHHIPAPWTARLAVNPEHFCSYGERKDNE